MIVKIEKKVRYEKKRVKRGRVFNGETKMKIAIYCRVSTEEQTAENQKISLG